MFYDYGLISITAYWRTVIHSPLTQLNVTSTGLGYYLILKMFPVPIMRLLQPSQLNESLQHRSREI